MDPKSFPLHLPYGESLVLYYSCDDLGGTTRDRSEHLKHGTITGVTPVWTSGANSEVFGVACRMFGHRIDIPDIDFGTTKNATYIMCISATSFNSTSDVMMVTGKTGDNDVFSSYLIKVSETTARFGASIESSTGNQYNGTDGALLALDTVYVLAVKFNRSTQIMTRYLDGEVYGTPTAFLHNGGAYNSLGWTQFGAYDNLIAAQRIYGYLYWLMVFERDVPQGEIRYISNNRWFF